MKYSVAFKKYHCVLGASKAGKYSWGTAAC